MISSKAEQLKELILGFAGLITFEYHGFDCSIDPFNPKLFHINFNGMEQDIYSINDLMTLPLFDGACLNDIAEKIENLDW